MRERILGGYDNFVLPFMIGMAFIFIYLLIGLARIFKHMPGEDRCRFFRSLVSPSIMLKNAKDILYDCLLHVKIFKRNLLLGYMHASIALGWFMLIVIGHIEVALYVPQRNGILYYPVFFRYFVKQEGDLSLKGAFFFFLMDFFLLMVLSGIGLAMYKRFRSRALGMRRTTKPCLADRIALICLWSIFPLRLLAESFTAGIAGGSFLTKPMYWLFSNFLADDAHILPTWWAYSIALGVFFLALPFSRYMHIPTEAFLIMLRNAGIKASHPRRGYAEAEIYSCSSCGICIDACPMNAQKKNLKYSSVYMIRFLRRRNKKKTKEIADKCLMCGKCVALCPVGVDSCNLKKKHRTTRHNGIQYDYSYLGNTNNLPPDSPVAAHAAPDTSTAPQAATGDTHTAASNAATPAAATQQEEKILYFAGCMTHLTPSILKSMVEILELSGRKYVFADKEGGICCGRPLMLAGREDAANEVIARNTQLIQGSGCNKVVLSCPICLKVLKEEYRLQGIELLHHTQFIDSLIKEGKIKVKNNGESMVYHSPCELGRGCGIYLEPLNVLQQLGELRKAEKEGQESICCGGSLGSLTLSYEERGKITQSSLNALTVNNPGKIITACPLCLKTFADKSSVPVMDIAQIVRDNIC
ncbi:MAG: (Fe-S)-binding protein [Bacteroidales bacterium]|nr:(Fe-S)-binding protein [Bacteroidales bacterium]